MKSLSQKGRGVLVVLAVGLAALLGVAAGLGALLGAATITARPPLFLLAGLAAFCAVYSLGVLLVTRKVGAYRRRHSRAALFCAGTALTVGGFALRVILVGHSHGGMVAAAYAASHPDHVAKMVLSSPGDSSPSAGGASMTFRLTTKEKIGVYALLLPPRPMLGYTLLQVNPEAAHAFAGDAEMDARFDRVYNRSRSALGFYAHFYPQSAAREPHADFLPDLAGLGAPALVIKGSCDYVSWSSTQEYLRVLPESRLAYLDGAGHNGYQDEPRRYMAEVRAFLLGRPPPESPYEGTDVPDDYEGPS